MAIEFLIIGITIVIGFLAERLFSKTRISSVIILMIFGFILGPILGFLDVSESSVIKSFLPFIASIALIFLLFRGGYEFDFFSFAKDIPKSIFFIFLVFLLSIILISTFVFFYLQWSITQAILFACVIGGSSSVVVISLIEKTNVKKETRSLVTLESTLTDALVIISSVIVIQLLTETKGNIFIGDILGLFLSSFSNAIIIGLFGAIIWIFILSKFNIQNYNFMLMLALLFAIFAVTEEFGGNGGIAVFTFGLALGNLKKISKISKMEFTDPLKKSVKFINDEITFFVKTFFFFYIGLLISLDFFRLDILFVGIIITIIILVSRYILVWGLFPDLTKKESRIITTMMPRGLAAAVVATLPKINGIEIPNFQEFVFIIIIISNIIATLSVFLFDKELNQ